MNKSPMNKPPHTALRWPLPEPATEPPVLPYPVVLDTNIVLDLLVFAEEPSIRPTAELLATGELRWLSNARQRAELERVLGYPQLAPRVAYWGHSVDSVLAAFDAGVQILPLAPRCRCICTDADDQHYLDLAAAHRAILLSRDRAVLKHRKRMLLLYGAYIGSEIIVA